MISKVVVVSVLLPLVVSTKLGAQDPQTLWVEFREALRGGHITADRPDGR